ncbi:TPA: hypothetical protein RPC60_005257 [Escherichia coli]|uniref:hypothetical protein n=1 Tax=Enterobacterales TaxID=91347 RepID=UPI000940FFAB|nr:MULTISPECIES: hypothetical protein [Enterobacterales]HDS7364839.1 hypothetical protein [Morganella morganii subsp. morganii]MCF2270431.1 hypothetical protein [Escherichia coli]MCF2371100.1 hypothetical protein [Escherichia coli]MDL2163034.1 hypothetical protein [Escherichia coli]MDM9373266.1 hypothetical protein [Escherichia coli]
MIQEKDKKALLGLRKDLSDQRLEERKACAKSIRENTEWTTERNGNVKKVIVVGVRNSKVVFKEDLSRADSASLSVEKFLKFYKPLPEQEEACA